MKISVIDNWGASYFNMTARLSGTQFVMTTGYGCKGSMEICMACSARVLTRSSGVMVDQDSAMGIRLLTTLNRAPRAYPAGKDNMIIEVEKL